MIFIIVNGISILQGQCLISVGGDVVFISYYTDAGQDLVTWRPEGLRVEAPFSH